jgi:hypothetical protein
MLLPCYLAFLLLTSQAVDDTLQSGVAESSAARHSDAPTATEDPTLDEPEEEVVETPSNILSQLLFPPRTRISAITAECLEILKYHKRREFKVSETLDLSDELSAVKVFVEQWSAAQVTLSKDGLSSSRASNLYRLKATLNSRVPSISVSNAAVGSFLSKWGVNNVTQSEGDDEAALQMAIQASLMQTGTGASAIDDTALELELAVIDTATTYRLSRWTSSFPENPDDVQWPTSFTTDEKKQMRDFVRDFLGDSPDMWTEDRSREDLASDVAEIRSSDDFAEFPVEKGKAASILQQVLKDVRNTKARSESRSTSRSQSRSERSESSDVVDTQTERRRQKRRRDSGEGDDEDGAGSSEQTKRSRTEPMRGRTRRRAGSPLKRQLTRRTTEEDEMLFDNTVADRHADLDDEDDEDFLPEEE